MMDVSKTFWLVLNLYTIVFAEFHVLTSEETYSTARQKCEIDNYRLAKVDDQDKYDTLVSSLPSYTSGYWVGLKLDEKWLPEYKYIYEDNTTATYIPWNPSAYEPNNQDSDKCVRIVISTNGHGFQTTHCSNALPFVCEDTVQESGSGIISSSSTSTPDSTTPSTIPSSVTTEQNSPGSTSHVVCGCHCNRDWTYKNASKDAKEIAEKLDEIKSKLSVDKKSLSSQQRKLISADDDRQSSAVMGYVGVIFITCIVVLAVFGDFVHVSAWLVQKCRKFI